MSRLFAVLVLAVILAGCSGVTGATAASDQPVATAAVDLPPSYRFDPAAITVPEGTTVTWTNDDNFTHSVQFLDGGLPTAPSMVPPGHTTSFTFTGPGLVHYRCSLHPQAMRGSVLVTAP